MCELPSCSAPLKSALQYFAALGARRLKGAAVKALVLEEARSRCCTASRHSNDLQCFRWVVDAFSLGLTRSWRFEYGVVLRGASDLERHSYGRHGHVVPHDSGQRENAHDDSLQ